MVSTSVYVRQHQSRTSAYNRPAILETGSEHGLTHPHYHVQGGRLAAWILKARWNFFCTDSSYTCQWHPSVACAKYFLHRIRWRCQGSQWQDSRVLCMSWLSPGSPKFHVILLVHGRPMPCVQKRPVLESKASSSRQFHVLSQNVSPFHFYIIIILNIVCSSYQV